MTEAEAILPGTSAQWAEWKALARALELAKGQRVTMYTKYSHFFLVVSYLERMGLPDC